MLRNSLLSSSLLVPFLGIYSFLSTQYSYTALSWSEVSSLPGIVWFSGVGLACLSVWFVSQRSTVSSSQWLIVFLFAPLVYLFVVTNNVLVFFMCYEFFLLPSFFIVFLGSPNRRGILSSVYFLMWTQVGSFLAFLAIILSVISSNSFLFSDFSGTPLVTLLAFLGFGINIPVWPAHYWLTNTHVEAPTYFSIYLSGFLVKTALYGLWVFFSFSPLSSYWFFFMCIACVGVVDSSANMWAQSDLNKLVAYGTVQEMNLILIGFLLNTSVSINAASFFILAHTILSTMFFLISDSLYNSFNARTTTSIRGLLNTHPAVGYTIFICCVFFAGLPFTLKFIVEVYIFSQLCQVNLFTMLFLLLFCNWVGIVGFMKHWFGCLFSSSSFSSSIDLSISELVVYSSLVMLLVSLSWVVKFLI